MARIVVDPVTRIEGHLRIEAEAQRWCGIRCLEFRNHVPWDRTDPARAAIHARPGSGRNAFAVCAPRFMP